MLKTDLSKDVEDTIRSVIAEKIGHFNVDQIRVAPWQEQDGSDALMVDVDFAETGDPIHWSDIIWLSSSLADALWNAGEERFPHVRFAVPDHRIAPEDKGRRKLVR
jgi:membrane-bound lytic murein transglycosylase MltF